MDRRDISKAIVGIAAVGGAGAIAPKAQAQTCTPPCFAQTTAEAAAGVTPTNYQYSPSHIGDDVRRFGNIDLTGGTDCSSILATADSVGVSLYFPPGIYRISANLTFTVPLIFDYGAILKPDTGVTVTINAPVWAGPWQIFNLPSAAALAGVLQPMNYEAAILVEWFGGGQGGSDDSPYFNQALSAAYNSGGLVVRLLAKNYNIAHSIYMAGSSSAVPGNLPCLWGTSGPGNSTPQIGTRISTAGAIITVVANAGDSSNIVKAGIKDIHFIGNGTDTSIQLNGCDFYDVERCTFDEPNIGVQFYCSSTSVYTEYCRAVKCVFNYCVTTAVRYTVNGGGFTSFHGCGLQDCWVNLNATSQKAVIIDTGTVYNAPLTFQCWTGGYEVTLIENNSTALSSCHGTITIEGGSPTVPIVIAGGTGIPISFAGKLNVSSSGCTSGNFTQCDVVQTNGTVMYLYGGRKTTTFPLSTGATQEAGGLNMLLGTSRLVTIDIVNTAQTYYYKAVLLVLSLNTGFTGQVTVLASYLQNNGAGYGAPTFAFGTSGGIVITNANYPSSGVLAVVESNQIGGLPVLPNYSASQGYAYI